MTDKTDMTDNIEESILPENGDADTSDSAKTTDGESVVEAYADAVEEVEGDLKQTSGETSADECEKEQNGTSAADGFEQDIYELIKSFPHLRCYEDVSQLPGGERYIQLRAAGLSPDEAYLAVNGRREIESRAEFDRIQRGQHELDHMKAAVHGGATPQRLMSEAQRRSARATIGADISDAELESLWKKVFGDEG